MLILVVSTGHAAAVELSVHEQADSIQYKEHPTLRATGWKCALGFVSFDWGRVASMWAMLCGLISIAHIHIARSKYCLADQRRFILQLEIALPGWHARARC